MHRRRALAALSLGVISGMTACHDSPGLAPWGELDADRMPGDRDGEDGVAHRVITGGGGCRLHLVETGHPRGQPILFLHGFSQSWLSWRAQLGSDLRRRFRLVAMDLRGHGASEQPRDAYADTRLWADDVDAAIRELSLDRPILSGWSYGPLVMLDYVRHYGESHIGGLHFVDGISKLGSPAAQAVLTPELLALVPGLFSTDAEASVGALGSLVRLMFAQQPSAADAWTMLGFNAVVPPHVRLALFSRAVDNDDVLATIRKPLLLTHGTLDAIVRPDVVEQHRRLVPHAQVQLVQGAGHAPFRDDARAFNRRLADFGAEVRRGA